MKVLLYCTKGKEKLYEIEIFGRKIYALDAEETYFPDKTLLNSTIVCECEINNTDYYEMEYYKNDDCYSGISIYDSIESYHWEEDCFEEVISNEYSDEEINNYPLLVKSCLSFDELGSYVVGESGIETLYALYLENIKVFDKPKKLDEYSITKTPQNMRYCYDKCGEKYVLISIKPDHLVKILNGEKTIEIRKKILKEMK